MRLCISLLAGAVALVAAPIVASAEGSGRISLVRDAETENTIRYFAAPLFKAAGLEADSITVHLVLDDRINAFVAGGQRIFINTGLLRSTQSPGAVIGVLAHETGHIANGHLAQMQENLRKASTQAIIGMLLGTAAAVASGDPGAAIAGASIGQSVGTGTVLQYSKANESQADIAALRYLDETGQSAGGLLEVLGKLQDQELLATGGKQDPYLRTHPLSQERISAVREHMAKSRFSKTPIDENLVLLHSRIRGKLNGYVDPPSRTLARYPASDKSVEARYARIQAFIKLHRTDDALAIVDHLIELAPGDVFFHELRGEVLYRGGRIAESVTAYRNAVAILEKQHNELPLIRLGLAQALLQIEGRETAAEAAGHLTRVTQYEPWSPRAWRLLATAWGRVDDFGGAAYALAEEALLLGNREALGRNVARALELLPEGSPRRERVKDIENLMAGAGKGE